MKSSSGNKMGTLILVVTLFVFCSAVFAQPPIDSNCRGGNLDQSFGGGMVRTNLGNQSEVILSSIVNPDGTIIAAGSLKPTGVNDPSLLLIKYLKDGSLDTSWSNSGIMQFDLMPGNDEIIVKLARQADGKLLALIRAFNPNPFLQIALMRFNTDGTIDTNFGIGGVVFNNMGGNQFTDAWGLEIQLDGKILLAGSTSQSLYPASSRDIVVLRYNSDGTLDTSFAGTGHIQFDNAGDYDVAYTIAVQPDRKIIVAGGSIDNNNTPLSQQDGIILRFHPNGKLDRTFGSNGVVTFDAKVKKGEFFGDIAIDDQDNIIAVASGELNNKVAMMVVRYLSNGTIDTSFANSGVFTPQKSKFDHVYGGAIHISDTGNIYLSGTAEQNNQADFMVFSLDSSGAVNSQFGNNGFSVVDYGLLRNEKARGMTFDQDNRLVLVGYSYRLIETKSDLALAAYCLE